MSRVVDNSKTMTSCLGSYPWCAPEVLSKSRYSTSADVFALGIILWELAAAPQELYQGMSGSQITIAVLAGERPSWDELPSTPPAWYRDLTVSCLAADSTTRPQATLIAERLEAETLGSTA
mmetsp:Transcript_39712/g.85993  ORF Transcript_39712/g.85993 Transcript_39712/m.85993 type:complete len:121 (+) Transcript_39712:310-672(+)